MSAHVVFGLVEKRVDMDVDVEILDDLFVARPDLLEDRGDVR